MARHGACTPAKRYRFRFRFLKPEHPKSRVDGVVSCGAPAACCSNGGVDPVVALTQDTALAPACQQQAYHPLARLVPAQRQATSMSRAVPPAAVFATLLLVWVKSVLACPPPSCFEIGWPAVCRARLTVCKFSALPLGLEAQRPCAHARRYGHSYNSPRLAVP